MALEISEIGIHVRVPDGPPAPGPAGETANAAAAARPSAGKTSDPCGDTERARMVDDCVRRVLRILDARRER